MSGLDRLRNFIFFFSRVAFPNSIKEIPILGFICFILCICVNVYMYVCMCTTCTPGVIGNYDSHDVGVSGELNLGSLQKQQALLTKEPSSPWSLVLFIKWHIFQGKKLTA